ncbi:hypothetical protein D3C81_1463830 [compost metagenome]
MPKIGTAHFRKNRILLAHSLDVHSQLIQLSQQHNFSVFEATGLLHQTTLNTGNKLVQRSGVLVAQHPSGHQRRNRVTEQVLGLSVETLQKIGLLQLVNVAQLTPYRHTGLWQIVDIRTQQLNSGIESRSMIEPKRNLSQFKASLEGGLQKGLSARVFRLLVLLLEEVEVSVVIEDQELFLVLATAEQVGSQSCASANHLPKFHPRLYRLGENEIDHFWHVDTCVQHVYRNGNAEVVVRFLEFLD